LNELILVLNFLLVGFSTGIFIGMLGIGGGIFFVPALYFLLPYSGIDQSTVPYYAISLSLFAGAIASSFSSVLHFRLGNIDTKKSLLFALGSTCAAFVSVIFVIDIDPIILKAVFAIVLFIIAVKMILDSVWKIKTQRASKLNVGYLPPIGIIVGILAAFTGLGGGIVFFPVLHYLFLLDTKKAIGTSSAITAATMIFASLAFYLNRNDWMGANQMSSIYFIVGVPLGIGAMLGARVGVNFVRKTNSAVVKKIFSVLLIIVVIKIILNLW